MVFLKKSYFRPLKFNPLWTWPFANLKRQEGGGGGGMATLLTSSQMMKKLGRDIPWVESFLTLKNFEDIIVISML